MPGGKLTAARAHASLSTLLVESTELLSGCSSMSGGGLWIPCNSIMREAGTKDSPDATCTYLDGCIGDAADVRWASSAQRCTVFFDQGPRIVDYLCGIGMQFAIAAL